MTRPGACDNYSRSSLCSLLSRDCLRELVQIPLFAHVHTAGIGGITVASWLASISRRRQRNVWHSLSQYVTHHPPTDPFHHRIGLLRVSSRCTAAMASDACNQCDQRLGRTSPTNWMPRNYETRNNSGGPSGRRETLPHGNQLQVYEGWNFFRGNVSFHLDIVAPSWNT